MDEREDISEKIRRFGIVCGIVAPVLYALVVIILGSRVPGYNHALRLMSELGETGAPYASFMNLAGFALTGVLIIFFAGAFFVEFRRFKTALPAAILLMSAGVCYTGEAFFHSDPGCSGLYPF